MPLPESRNLLLSIYQAALKSVEGQACVSRYLHRHIIDAPCHVIAIGKAAHSMAQGARAQLGAKLQRSLVITKYGHSDGDVARTSSRDIYLEAGHPIPDHNSLVAGQALLSFIAQTPLDDPIIFLISGGSSALVEVLPDNVGLESLQAINDYLLASGLDIVHMNQVRKALSCIKGGRLVTCLEGRSAFNLLLSDVPDNDPSNIGSGLLVSSHSTLLPDGLPAWILDLIGRAPAQPTTTAPCFEKVHTSILATNQTAREAAAEAGRALGLAVHAHEPLLLGDAIETGVQLAEQLHEAAPGLHIWGGETTCTLPAEPGRGGRCQAMALSMAMGLTGCDDVTALAVGTDGTDGSGDDAGALIDGGTLARGELGGFSAGDSLSHADSGSFLEASGDLVQTGPTGSNVMDLVLVLKL